MFKYATLALLLLSVFCFAQNTLKGNIKDENNHAADNVSLILYPKMGDNILAYTSSNSMGNFSLSYFGVLDSLRLEISSLAYSKKVIFLDAKNIPFLNVELKTSVNSLPEVVFKDKRPISKRGDTVNYDPKYFADKTDRVVIDVIKNLPGIKVTDAGQILYNNKAINKFYVDGKDLLEDRYSIASNNLPLNAVEQIQVLENHQPIKLLDSIQPSDRAAINIKLNNNAKLKLLGNGTAGFGLSPLLRNNNLALLKFNKSVQYINTAKNNNIGINLANELTEQNINKDVFESGGIKRDLLNLVQTSPPPLAQSRYWFNDNTLVGCNFLIGTGNQTTLKFNLAYVNDNLKNYDSSITSVFLPNDTLVINESHSGDAVYHKFISGLVFEKNTKKLYLRNASKFERLWSTAEDFISSNNLNQSLKNPFANFTNVFNGFVKVSSNILQFRSFTSYSNLPQQLNVEPGQYNVFLNNGLPYDGLQQTNQLQTFYNNNQVGYSKKNGVFVFSDRVGVKTKLQKLNNALSLQNTNLLIPANGNFEAEIFRKEIDFYNEFSVATNYKKVNFNLGLNLESNFLENKGQGFQERQNLLFFNPGLNIIYKISSFWETTLSLLASNDAKYNANPSFILQDYRTLLNNDVPLNKTKSQSVNYLLNYRNIIYAIFGSLNVNYSHNQSNVLLQTNFNGISVTQTAISQNNPSTNFSIKGNINKYYLALKTGIDINLNYNANNIQQVQQGLLTNFETKTIDFSTRINTKVSPVFSLVYSLNFTRFYSFSKQSNVITDFTPINYLLQKLDFNLFLPKEYSLKINLEHYYNNANQLSPAKFFYADLNLQKRIVKPKLDIAIAVTNILNAKSYINYSYNNNFLINTNYALRGRIFMAKVGFQF